MASEINFFTPDFFFLQKTFNLTHERDTKVFFEAVTGFTGFVYLFCFVKTAFFPIFLRRNLQTATYAI